MSRRYRIPGVTSGGRIDPVGRYGRTARKLRVLFAHPVRETFNQFGALGEMRIKLRDVSIKLRDVSIKHFDFVVARPQILRRHGGIARKMGVLFFYPPVETLDKLGPIGEVRIKRSNAMI